MSRLPADASDTTNWDRLDPPEVDVERALAQLSARIEVEVDVGARRPALSQVKRWHRHFGQGLVRQPLRGWGLHQSGILVALTVLLAVGVGVLTVGHMHYHSVGARPDIQYTTRTDQYATTVLSDGSRVTLFPQTTLRVASQFGNAGRDVWMDGEANFDVQVTSGAPFVVHTGRVTTRVLGTTFGIRRDAAALRVMVMSGKVSVRGIRGQPATVIAGQSGLAVDSSGVVTVLDNRPPYSAWADGRVVFRNTPLSDVLAVLSQWYGYRFRLADTTLARQNLTVWVSTESFAMALSTITTTLGVEASVDTGVVTLRPRDRQIHPAPASRGRLHIPSPQQPEVGR